MMLNDSSIIQSRILCLSIVIVKFCEICAFESNISNSSVCVVDKTCSIYGKRWGGPDRCCQPCLCPNSCDYNCCPDISQFEPSLAECKHQLDFIAGLNIDDYFDEFDDYMKRRFYVVSKCPLGTPYDVKLQCELNTRPDENLYVQETRTDTTYKNKACAECNGVTLYETWRKSILVKDTDVKAYMNRTNVNFQSENEVMMSVPPEGLEEMKVCSNNDISTCNETGQWDVYDANLVELCQLSSLYSVTIGYKQISYRNIYCVLCNKPSSEPIANLKCNYHNKLVKKFPRNMIRLLLWPVDDQWGVQSAPGNKEEFCPTISQLESLCDDIICPVGQAFFDGRCLPQRFEIYNMIIQVEFDLEIHDQIKSGDDVVQFIRDNIVAKFELQIKECLLGFIGLKHSDNSTTNRYKMCLLVHTTHMCDLNTLLTDIRRFEIQFYVPNTFYTSNSGIVHVTASISSSRPSELSDEWIYWKVNGLTKFQSDAILKPNYFCPSVTYSTAFVRSKLAPRVLSALLLASKVYVSDETRTDDVKMVICLSQYRHIAIENAIYSSKGVKIFGLTQMFYIIAFGVSYFEILHLSSCRLTCQ